MPDYTDKNYDLYPKTGGGRGFKTTSGTQDNREWREVDGYVETPHGFVRAHSWFFENAYRSSTVEMIKDGKNYTRRWKNREYSARGLVTKAKQFAAELYE